MSNTTPAKHAQVRFRAGALAIAVGMAAAASQTVHAQENKPMNPAPAAAPNVSETLTARQHDFAPTANEYGFKPSVICARDLTPELFYCCAAPVCGAPARVRWFAWGAQIPARCPAALRS